MFGFILGCCLYILQKNIYFLCFSKMFQNYLTDGTLV